MTYNGVEVAPIYFNNGELAKYVVTRTGHVFNTNTNKELKPKIDSKGYLKVSLSHNGETKDHRIHVLVAKGFVHNPSPNEYKFVC